MASNSSDASATPVSIICSVCVESLTSDGSDLVTTNCGHAFHKVCLSDWYNSDNKDKSRSERRYRCPKCNKMTKSDCTRDLYLDAEDDTEYVDIVKTVEQLRHEKAEAIEKLSLKDAEIIKQRQENIETVDHLRQELERLHEAHSKTANTLRQKKNEIVSLCRVNFEEMERFREEHDATVRRFNREHSEQIELLRQEHMDTIERLNQDLKKQNTVIEIQSILLGTNKDLLDEQFGQLKWDDLTLSFQNELWKKVPHRFHALQFNKSVSLSSNTLIRLIKSGPNDEELFLKLIEDYCDQQKKLNGSVTWTDFTKLFKQDLLPWLREICEHPSLELDDLPLTPKTIMTLMEAEEDETKRGSTLVARIVELFVENESDFQINDICRRAIKQAISTVVPKKLEFCPCSADMYERLVLRRSGKLPDYDCCEDCDVKKFLVHISVMGYFAAMVVRRTIPPARRKPRYEEETEDSALPWPNYFLKYFYGTPSALSLKWINLRDEMTLDLVTIYILMSPMSIIFPYFMEDQTSAYRKRLLRMLWPFKVKTYLIHLTLLHLAALKGKYYEVQFLLCNMDFSQVLEGSQFQDLVQICVLETYDQSNEQIQERKKIIATFLKCSKNVAAAQNTHLTNVHIDLLKFLVERGPEVHANIWSKNQMLLEAAEYLNPDQFHDLAKWLVKKGHLEMLKERDAEGASPLDLAIRRINVKPETIQLFRNAGDVEEEGEEEEIGEKEQEESEEDGLCKDFKINLVQE